MQIARSERARWIVRAKLAGETVSAFRANVWPMGERRAAAGSRVASRATEIETAHNLLALESQI